MKNFIKLIFLGTILLFPCLLCGQTQPTPQDITGGYVQDFSSLTGNGNAVYPNGFKGWLVANGAPSTTVRTNEPISDLNIRQSGNASSTTTGIYDYSGKLGLLSSSFSDLAIVLAINTSSVMSPNQVQISFDAMVLRNLYDGSVNNMLNTLVLQYRIGETGSFTNVNNVAKNGTTTNTTGVNGVDIKNSIFKLPLACNNQPVVQLRWIIRAVSGNAGSRPSFAIDNIMINGVAPTSTPPFTGYQITSKNITIVSGTTYQTNVLNEINRSANLNHYLASSDDYVGTTKAFFTTYKNPVSGVWNFVDPEGFLFYSTAVNQVLPGGGVDPVHQLREINSNTIGNFSDETITVMPYTPRLNLGDTYTYTNSRVRNLYLSGIFPVFDPDFVSHANTRASTLITPEKIADKNLIGYFSDNEVKLGNPFSGDKLIVAFLKVSNYGGQTQADNDPNYIAAVNWMKSRHGGVLTNPNQADIQEWPGYLADRYYSVCKAAIRAVDTNHLYIGSRLHQDLLNPYLFQAAGRHLDVVSANNYNVWTEASINARLNVWADNAQKPFLIGEFYAMAQDSGLPNDEGAGYKVYTQQDRADFFEHYTMTILKHKASVGFQFFKYRDDPASSTDPLAGSNKGLLNKDYEWWEPMKNSFSKISKDIYRLRNYLITGNQTLPVVLKQFTAVKLSNEVKILWETAEEYHHDYFELLHSTDGIHFKQIKKTSGKLNSSTPVLYSFYHQNPSIGNHYYKLIQYDLDGKQTDYGTKVVTFLPQLDDTVQVYPNPSSGLVNIIFNTQEEIKEIKIYDLSGTEKYHVKLDNTKQKHVVLNLKDQLSSGLYLLQMTTSKQIKYSKLILQ
ncbi:T9SS type A sorting domain-containing protein [Pedobacter glucosidilyticus]|uniref:T9SS type A sorting domain-containing protein n=1 Tax=Pedobacter glucosidilyticus TaxID=1122941 RepID=UPI0026ED712B|nr:T9SS type A sorting domain-containing protein [Pedobacter glucosidilyticus]